MRNKYITRIFPAFIGALVVAGGGCMSKPLDQPSATSSSTVVSTTPVEAVSSKVLSTTSTTPSVSLVDRPVSEWPRYEFKELGFSIQLPFVSSSLRYKFNTYCPPYLAPCSNTTTMHSYTGILNGKKTDYLFIGSYSKNYEYDRDGNITDINDLNISKNPYLIFFGNDSFQLPIHPINRILVQNKEVIIFNAYDDYYKNSNYGINEKEWAFTFSLPYSDKLKAVIFVFDDIDFPLEKIKMAIKTLKFKRT